MVAKIDVLRNESSPDSMGYRRLGCWSCRNFASSRSTSITSRSSCVCMCWHHTITGERGTSKVALALTIHTQIYHNKKAHTKDNKAKQLNNACFFIFGFDLHWVVYSNIEFTSLRIQIIMDCIYYMLLISRFMSPPRPRLERVRRHGWGFERCYLKVNRNEGLFEIWLLYTFISTWNCLSAICKYM